MLYVEWDTLKQQIVSFGHNYLYRWSYGDTIRQIYSTDTNTLIPRPELNPITTESVNKESGKLSGARLFFGYVADTQDNEVSATQDIGEGEYSRMAGRISINNAIEHLIDPINSSLSSRFTFRSDSKLTEGERLNIPLKPLGTPKASAVEHYIDQSQLGKRGLSEATVTYGDLPGAIDVGDQRSQLSGRKFYIHQHLLPNNESFEDKEYSSISSSLGSLARYISKPGSQFRMSVRFKDLRLWELGTLLLTLEPDLLLTQGVNLPTTLKDYLKSVGKQEDSTLFAHKLGYGRPLGLGSTGFQHHKIQLLTFSENSNNLTLKDAPNELLVNSINAFLEMLNQRQILDNLIDWLTVMNYAQRGEADYPRSSKGTVFEYHTNIRRDHAVKRRQ